MRKADLHLHTTPASEDAIQEPEEVFRQAKQRGLAAVAFTDHDNMVNVEQGRRLSETYGVAFLTGIEINSSWRGENAHVLGYFPSGAAPLLQTFLVDRVWQGRRRAELMLMERLRHRGVEVTVAEHDAEALAEEYRGSALYRVLLNQGKVSSLKDYVALIGAKDLKVTECFYPPISEVIQAVHQAGGIAALAHPGVDPDDKFYRFDAEAIAALATAGLDGVKAFHPVHSTTQREYYARVADRLGLVTTGGSDRHGHETVPDRMVGGTYCDWDKMLRYMEQRAGHLQQGKHHTI
jgi:predicted metal-dependent phosphoesterase TrpH